MPLNIDSWPEPTTDETILAGWGEAVNEDIRDLAAGSVTPAGAEPILHFAWDSATTVGLTFGVKAGVMWDGTTLSVKVPQTVALTNNATNYVELTRATGVISKNTVGFTASLLPLFQVTTAGGVVTAVLDRRAPYALDGNSGGGGGSGTSNAPLCHMWAFGDLTDPSAYGIDLDYFRVKQALTINQITTGIDQTPGAGSVVIDIFKNGVSLFPTIAKPTVACTGARNCQALTGGGLETVSLLAGDILTFRLVSAPAGARTVTVDIYTA